MMACCPNCTAWFKSACRNMSYLKSQCKICGCNILEHVFEDNTNFSNVEAKKDENIENVVEDKQNTINSKKLTLFELKLNKKKYEVERQHMENVIMKLKSFLEENSVLSDQRKLVETNR